jgi:diguanylate cyclase
LEQDHWERKYHLALERMERDEQVFRSLEACLRRLVSRVALLGRGQSAETDTLLDRLAGAIRDDASAEVLEPFLAELGEAISRLDAGAAQPVAAIPVIDAGGAAEMLRQVLLRIVLVPALAGHAVELRAALAEATDVDTVSRLANQVADLVNRQRESLRADMATLEELLREVSGRLEEMTRYLATELEDQSLGMADSRDLDSTVRKEMRLLDEQTREAADLTALQRQVSARLEQIDQHFRDYRDREEARLAAYRDRAERMRDRVEELETQATSLQDSLRREHERSLTDPLTGMPNRLAFEKHIEEGHRDWMQAKRPLCVAAFDIDHFKAINDGYGHGAGDAVLRIVGQVLMAHASAELFVSRYGGEEFAVVFAGMELAEAMSAADRLRAAVEGLAFHASARPVKVTMSGGVARLQEGDSPAGVFERADRALYAAKRAGRNRCVAA